jgi:hypothetical protein
MHVDNFETSVFIPGREYESFVVGILGVSGAYVSRLDERNGVVGTAVLVDIRLYLCVGVNYLIGIIVD